MVGRVNKQEVEGEGAKSVKGEEGRVREKELNTDGSHFKEGSCHTVH